MEKWPNRKPLSPAWAASASRQKRAILAISSAVSVLSSGVGKWRANSIGSVARRAANPECMAALMERATARALGDAGQSCAWG